jgi:hypothetical protein
MGLIDKAAVEAEMTLERDVPVIGQRRVKDWAKLIGIARKLEAADNEAIETERRRSRELEAKIILLQEENFALQKRLFRADLADRLEQMAIPQEDRVKLLETGKSIAG